MQDEAVSTKKEHVVNNRPAVILTWNSYKTKKNKKKTKQMREEKYIIITAWELLLIKKGIHKK